MSAQPEWWVVFVSAAPEGGGHIVRYAFADRDPVEALIPGPAPSDQQISELAALLLTYAPAAVEPEPVGVS